MKSCMWLPPIHSWTDPNRWSCANNPRASCRLLVLRFLAAFLGGATPGLPQLEATIGRELALVLLGMDPDRPNNRREIDLDASRAGQETPLDAVMSLLENPPPVPQAVRAWQPGRPSIGSIGSADVCCFRSIGSIG